MTVRAIFPGSLKEIDDKILNYMPSRPSDLVALSGTHKFAYATLSNGTYFQQLFAQQHPLLSKTDQVFSHLRTHYQDCCWKVACCSMLKDYTPFYKEFLQRPTEALIPLLIQQEEALAPKKMAVEQGLKRICGSYYQDPDSPIHQAWETAYGKGKAQYDSSSCENGIEIEKLLGSFDYSISYFIDNLQPLDGINLDEVSYEEKKRAAILQFSEFLTDEGCIALLSEDITTIQRYPEMEFLDFNRINEYQEVIPILLEFHKKQKKSFLKSCSSISEYNILECRREYYVKEVLGYSYELAYIEKNLANVWQYNHLCLLIDQYFARNAKKLFKVDSLCTYFTLSDIENRCVPQKQALIYTGSVQMFKDFLNDQEEGSLIWEMLYRQCANGIHEHQWAENHFYEFPQEFAEIVTRLQSLAKDFKPVYFKNLDLGAYVSENYEAIKEGLEDQLKCLKAIEDSRCSPRQTSTLLIWFRKRLSTPVFNLLTIANDFDEVFPMITSLINHLKMIRADS